MDPLTHIVLFENIYFKGVLAVHDYMGAVKAIREIPKEHFEKMNIQDIANVLNTQKIVALDKTPFLFIDLLDEINPHDVYVNGGKGKKYKITNNGSESVFIGNVELKPKRGE